MKLFFYILIIGFTIATYRAGFKLVSINGLLGVAFVGIAIFFLAICAYLVSYGFQFPKFDTKSMFGVGIAALSLVISSYFIISGMQSGFKVSTFTPAYAIVSVFFVYMIGVVIFKESIVWQNSLGLLFGILAIYCLSFK